MKNRSQHAITSTINIDEKWSHAHLPALALQMTVENCFKHNSLTTENPLLINIETTSDGYVEISNNIQSKISEIEKSVKGIELIQKRYKLMNINEGVRIDREVDSKMRILLVEDETHTAALLKEIIEQKDDCHVVKILETVVDTVFYLSGNQDELDLCFFDIQLADRDSFEIFRHVDVVLPIIFCTSFDEYAMKAIKNNGIDYVLKPFKEEGIHSALDKYIKLVSKILKGNSSPITFENLNSSKQQSNFLTHFRGKTMIKRIDEVALFYIKNEIVYLVTFDGEKFPLHKKMEHLESICDPKQFYRVNRLMLLSREAIVSFESLLSRKNYLLT